MAKKVCFVSPTPSISKNVRAPHLVSINDHFRKHKLRFSSVDDDEKDRMIRISKNRNKLDSIIRASHDMYIKD